MVTAQLRYSGLLETVRIRKEGFPVRLPFQVFIDRYLGLVLPELCRPLPLTQIASVCAVMKIRILNMNEF